MTGAGLPLCHSSAIILVIGSSINYAPSSWCGLLFFSLFFLFPASSQLSLLISEKEDIIAVSLSNDSLHYVPVYSSGRCKCIRQRFVFAVGTAQQRQLSSEEKKKNKNKIQG